MLKLLPDQVNCIEQLFLLDECNDIFVSKQEVYMRQCGFQIDHFSAEKYLSNVRTGSVSVITHYFSTDDHTGHDVIFIVDINAKFSYYRCVFVSYYC